MASALFRHTPQRQLVLLAVKSSREFRTAEQVFQAVRRLAPRIGFATVYRNLNLLSERGEIFSFEGDDGRRRFAGFVFHAASFTCQRCGQVKKVAVPELERALAERLRQNTLFFTRLEARGFCRQCTADLNHSRRAGVRT